VTQTARSTFAFETAGEILANLTAASGAELHVSAGGEFTGWALRWTLPDGRLAELDLNLLTNGQATMVLSLMDYGTRKLVTMFGRYSAAQQD
jgi:hypothetical protein